MTTLSSFEIEYERIVDSKLWGLFVEKVEERRAKESRFCETKENVAWHQGAVDALDFVIGRGDNKHPLIERLLAELRENKS